MGHRYYDPHLARFLTRDPSGYAAGLNLYAYAGNNPACYADPDGHFVLLITGAIGAGVGAVIGGGIAWWNGDNIWVGAGKGFVLGGTAGLTGGIAGEAVAGWIGGTAIANGAIGGFVGGVVGDAAQQGTAILLHWRCGFSVPEALASGALGGVLGGAGGWWASTGGRTAARGGGTVWDYITPTQPEYPGTVLPRSFTVTTESGGTYWVHGNATVHIAGYAAYMTARGASPEAVNLGVQQNLSSLRAAIGEAEGQGIEYGRMGTAGGWELRFELPREEGLLPALIHARMQ